MVVTLNSAADLERLRHTNLPHYLRAQKIIAAANVICHPGSPGSSAARFDEPGPHCGELWLASNPPKKVLSFDLDDVHYIALVTVAPVRALAAGKMQKVDAAKAVNPGTGAK